MACAKKTRSVRCVRHARVITGGALAIGLLAAFGSGCLHHSDMAACTPAPGETACWESTRTDADGRPQHVIVERVKPGDRCDTVRIEQSSFDEHGVLLERAVEERRCGVVDLRILDRYDLTAGRLVREIWTDENHDDQFDRVIVHGTRMSPRQRAYAERLGEAAASDPALAHERTYRTLQAIDVE